MKKTFIYVLKLTNDNYYIGRTKNLKNRIDQHLNGNGSVWTKKHPIVEVEKIIETEDNFQEDVWVKKYIEKYGIDHVRGGSYSEIVLDENQKRLIEKEIRNTKDECFNCGSNKHFVKNCDIKTNKKRKKYYEDDKSIKIENDNNISSCNQPEIIDNKSYFNNFASYITSFF